LFERGVFFDDKEDFICNGLSRKRVILSYHFVDFLLYGVDNVPRGLSVVVEIEGRIGCHDSKEAASKKLRNSDIELWFNRERRRVEG